MKICLRILVVLILTSCASNVKLSNSKLVTKNYEIKFDSINLFDKSRNRNIPVALYLPKTNLMRKLVDEASKKDDLKGKYEQEIKYKNIDKFVDEIITFISK